MFKHILLPTDGSKLSEQCIDQAIAFAKSISAQVTGITVSEPYLAAGIDAAVVRETQDAYLADCEQLAKHYLDVIDRAAVAAGVPFNRQHVFSMQPYAAIIDMANERGCDVICMASHGRRGLPALLLGSETIKVLTHSKIPVLVWR